jgi:Zn finger protein HypA/HybF involved in hydrogenase expression
MTSCKHANLELLPERKNTLRCRRCHLTISADELGDGFCPECFDSSGAKNYDFETITAATHSGARYRCEDCGAIIAAT